MNSSLLSPELLIGIGALCFASAAAMVGLLVAAVLGRIVWRWLSSDSGPSRDEMLEEVGYQKLSSGGWTRPLFDTHISFDDTKGFRWTIRLPRYNTLSLAVEERSGGETPRMNAFVSEVPELDARFLIASERAAQTVALVRNPAFGSALLALPYVSLRLHGDELVLQNPKRVGASGSGKVAVTSEREIHEAVAVLVGTMFDCMYARDSGTIMPDFR